MVGHPKQSEEYSYYSRQLYMSSYYRKGYYKFFYIRILIYLLEKSSERSMLEIANMTRQS